MSIPVKHRAAWIEVDLDAIVANAVALRSLIPPGTGLVAVIKANAYGHGAVPVAAALEGHVEAFGVATLDEGLALRDGGIRGRIVILYEIPPGAAAEAVARRLEPSVGSLEVLREVNGLDGEPRPEIHLKIDTGMTRQGIRPEQIEPWADEISRATGIVRGVWTHLRDGADAEGTAAQRAAFERALEQLAGLGVRGERHVSASAAILAGSVHDEELVRPGLALVGALPDEFTATGADSPVELRPAMAVRARPLRVVDVPPGTPVGYGGTFVTARPSRLATLPLGYADGIPRTLSNGHGHALARGRRVPFVGRVSMDSVVVDVTELPEIGREDVLTVLGRDGSDAITLEDASVAAGTIPQEFLVRLNGRLPRHYR